MSFPTVSAPKVLLFDVNETLLDLAALHESVDSVLLEHQGSKQWFSKLLHYSLVLTVSGQYRPLPEIGVAVLQMMATNRDVMLSEEDAKKALEPLRSAPAHPDVLPALDALRSSGIRMAALTNSSSEVLRAQLEHAGIAPFLERQLSVESVGKYKPHRDVYAWAAEQMQVPLQDCMLVAAHPWDVAGAAWAGMRTAFLARLGVQPLPIAPKPDIEALDLGDLAQRLGAAA
ncbi:haloacid dehalogenase type II [Massilia sp. H6]|uniref:haloacid dehalogenase type II n=1 Tax=Massilia sp. H6 TaxID=2970464 RepID=UPI00216A332E|nr:haloacid dehalogenase type II [Massilia sp. H6]UVW28774.1 haloacid dehalogenase type II [Massilia sp. H6]